MSISSEITRITSEVNTQAGLIQQIKTALEGKVAGGGNTSEPSLQTKTVTPTKSVQNVTPDSGYDGLSKVTVNAIPSEYIVPSGTKSITTNGTHDVNNYKNVDVNVPIPSGYIKPSGSLSITTNGTYDVTEKASVTVNVPTGGGSSEDLNDVLLEQSALLNELSYILDTKAGGGAKICSVDINLMVSTFRQGLSATIHYIDESGIFTFNTFDFSSSSNDLCISEFRCASGIVAIELYHPHIATDPIYMTIEGDGEGVVDTYSSPSNNYYIFNVQNDGWLEGFEVV